MMDKAELYKEIMDKLMGMPYGDDELKDMGKPGQSVVKIEIVGGDDGDDMGNEPLPEAGSVSEPDEELRKKLALMGMAK